MSSHDGSGGSGGGHWNSGGWGPYGHDPATGRPEQPYHSAYQGFGVFESGQQTPFVTPPRRSRAPMIAVIVGAVVVLLGGATAAVAVALNSSGSSRATPPPNPTATIAPTTTAPTTTRSSGSTTSGQPSDQQTFTPPVVPGWRGVSWPAYGIAYDVPPSWRPKPGTDLGVGDDTTPKHVIVSAASLYMEGYCPSGSSYRAITGVTSSQSQDATASATKLLDNWANYGFTAPSGAPPKVTKTPPRDVTLTDNRKGTLASATITPPAGVPCSAPQEAISVVAVSGSNGTAMLLALGDEGVPGAVSPQDLQKIVTSLRWTQ